MPSLKYFTDPAILRQIGPARLNLVLGTFSADLKAANLVLPQPDSENDNSFSTLAAALEQTDFLPNRLRTTLLTLEEAASPQNRHRLFVIIFNRLPCVGLGGLCPLDQSLELWFKTPDELTQFTPPSLLMPPPLMPNLSLPSSQPLSLPLSKPLSPSSCPSMQPLSPIENQNPNLARLAAPHAPRLLADLLLIFTLSGATRLFSKDIATALRSLPDRPWSNASNSHRPIDQTWLTRQLRPLGISPHNVRIANRRANGYDLADFTDAFARYLSNPNPHRP